MSFVQPAFWYEPSGRRRALHAVSTLVTAPIVEPLTLIEAKLRAGQDWAAGDARDALMTTCVVAARMKVETDTALALLTQTRDVLLDVAPIGGVLTLPDQSTPLQSITSVTSYDTSGAANILAPSNYQVDTVSGRIGLTTDGVWPLDLRPFQPIAIRIVAGYANAAAIPAPLVLAVGLMAAHYFTAGRDVVITGTIVSTTPYGYEDLIAPYRVVSLI